MAKDENFYLNSTYLCVLAASSALLQRHGEILGK